MCPPRPDQMTVSPATRRPGLPLHWKMGIGFAVGLLLGLAVYYLAGSDAEWVRLATKYVATPFSQVFLNLIFMLIVPLLFSALVMGISEMGDIRALGRVGWRTLGYTVVLSGVAVLLGL
ncbi:dicarboxylate/amino acid:cation symporter, partial [Xanthomonas perforans]